MATSEGTTTDGEGVAASGVAAGDEGSIVVAIWDLPTRLFHWSLALLVVASVVTGKFDSLLGGNTLEWHRRLGLAIAGLLLFRLGWGFAGGRHARFANFLRGPRSVFRYARKLFAKQVEPESAGHNPLGGWSVAAMLATVAMQVGTGLFLVQEDYAFEGPLARHVSRAVSDRLGGLHAANFYVIAVLVALHVAAIAFYTVAKRQDLVGAMVTGRKWLAAGREIDASSGGGMLAAAAVAIAAAAAVWALVTYA